VDVDAISRFGSATLPHQYYELRILALINQRIAAPVSNRILDGDHGLSISRRHARIRQVVAKVSCDQYILRVDNEFWKCRFVLGKDKGDEQECQKEAKSASGHGILRQRS